MRSGYASCRSVERFKAAVSLVKLRFRRFVIGVYHLRLSVQLIERRHPDGYLAHSQLVAQDEIFLCRFRLAAQRLDLKLKLIDLIIYAKKIFLGFFKLALGFLPLRLR